MDIAKDMLKDMKAPNKISLKYFPHNLKGNTTKRIIIRQINKH
jgi:hypothetical protein